MALLDRECRAVIKHEGNGISPEVKIQEKESRRRKNMALFQAFRAVRPAPENAAQVAALPYDVVSREEAREIGENNPESFLHVDRAEMDLDPSTDLYDPKVYQKEKRIWTDFRKKEYSFRMRSRTIIYMN